MPGCVLRAGGEGFEAERFLRNSPWQPDRMFPTGFNLLVSERPGDDAEGQIEDVMRFLATNADELRRLIQYPNVESSYLDLAVTLTPQSVARSVRLPRQLIQACSEAGVEIELSIYLCSDND